MKIKKLSLVPSVLLLCSIFFCTLNAQNLSFNDVLQLRLRNSGPIVENDNVVGYYFFYYVDRKDAKNNNYILKVVDENLESVFSKRIVRSKDMSLLDVVYNGKVFLLNFLDKSEKGLSVATYDAAGEKLGKKTLELSKNNFMMYEMNLDSEEGSNSSIFPAGNEGFVLYTVEKNSKLGYAINYLPNNLNRDSTWKMGSSEKSELIELGSNLGIDQQYVFSNIMKKKKLLSNKDIQNTFQVIDYRTKEKLFEKLTVSGQTSLFPINAFYLKEKDQFLVFGTYYPPKEDPIKGDSEGVMCMIFDKAGKIVAQKKYSWVRYFKEAMDKNKKGEIKGSGSIYLHKIVQTADGHIYAIGEYFRKVASAGGIAAMALSGGRGGISTSKMMIRNLVIMELNPSLEMLGVEVIEKPRNNIALPQGLGANPPGIIAAFMKTMGWFDYSFTQVTQDKTTFTTAFQSYDREEKGEKELFLNFVSRTTGEEGFVTDKLPLSTDASKLSYYPAKPGYVLIAEYYKKAKKLDVHLEKVNF